MADIHFQPKVAMLVAEAFEKIRINPGNFSDGRKTFEEMTYDDPAQFAAEREYMRTVSPHTAAAYNHLPERPTGKSSVLTASFFCIVQCLQTCRIFDDRA